ncbi:Crp/Fnr family transcriptional regulator [Arcticibacterium luteifluviistationis]|uniref:Crp/Fnr family transcriptional regulator n=1 Tax=Arcticibacterium luteifluviistationis TaxID=1784714 RepID=A0A2Z4G7R6_9BACT|nr:Crp/Fnr family transcriptional regulator [Arcticibacterium luteifluviistationis]AWV97108.1 Crp/Fnr family transcriptional regulator [Arcticibacterium luteifluviistationis]
MISDFLLKLVPFSPNELNDIVSHFEKEHVAKDEVLIKEGQICHKLYFIEQGIGRSYYLKEDGKDVTQWFFGDGNFMTSADSFFQQSPSLYFLEVLEDAVLYSITKEKMDLLLAKYHKMETLSRLVTIEILNQIVQKLNAIQFQTAKERYNYMLADFPDIAQRVSLGHIASYLGITQETLSRIRRKN